MKYIMDTRLQDLADKAVRYSEQVGAEYCDVSRTTKTTISTHRK